MLYGLNIAFDVTKSIILAVLNKVTGLNSCIDYFYKVKHHSGRLELCDFYDFIANDFYSDSEGLILIKAGYRDDGVERMKKEVAAKIPKFSSNTLIDRIQKQEEEYRAQQVSFRNKILDDPELYKRAMKELESCKANNIEKLKGYGLF